MLYFVPTYFFENNNNEKEYSVIYTSIKRLLYLKMQLIMGYGRLL